MTYIVMDLEWNGAFSHKAHGYFNEIIEIGAVKMNEALQLVDSYHVVIKPVVNKKLSELVTNLTNIADDELQEGIPFTEAMAGLKRWIGNDTAAVLTWSTTDLLVLLEDFRYFCHTDTIPFMDAYADLQAYFQSRVDGLAKGQQVGLSRAGEMLQLDEQDIDFHRALDDSAMTSRIFAKIYDADSFAAFLRPADAAFYDRITFKTTIISDISSPLINRSELRFNCPDCGKNMKRTTPWKFYNRAFSAGFCCRCSEKAYVGRIQFKQKYDGIDMHKRLSVKVKKEAEVEQHEETPEGTV